MRVEKRRIWIYSGVVMYSDWLHFLWHGINWNMMIFHSEITICQQYRDIIVINLYSSFSSGFKGARLD